MYDPEPPDALAVQVEDWFVYIDVGDALQDTPESGGYAVVIAVHEPQLLPSFDSVTALPVSAQARMYHVP